MKRLAVFAVMGLILSTAVFANNVVVFQDGQATVHKPGTEIAINAKTTTRVLYNGVLITVPKGQKVQISKSQKTGKIEIFGINMRGVEVAGKQVSSKGQAKVSVSPDTREVVGISGNTTIVSNEVIFINKNKTQNNNKVVNNQTVTQTNIQTVSETPKKATEGSVSAKTQTFEPVVFPSVSEYVNEVAAQQATQDVERPDMSQSSTTGA